MKTNDKVKIYRGDKLIAEGRVDMLEAESDENYGLATIVIQKDHENPYIPETEKGDDEC